MLVTRIILFVCGMSVDRRDGLGLSEVELRSIHYSAELLYGLAHSRYILTPTGTKHMVTLMNLIHQSSHS